MKKKNEIEMWWPYNFALEMKKKREIDDGVIFCLLKTKKVKTYQLCIPPRKQEYGGNIFLSYERWRKIIENESGLTCLNYDEKE